LVAKLKRSKNRVNRRAAPKSKIINAEQLLRDVKRFRRMKCRDAASARRAASKRANTSPKRFKESGIKPFKDSYLQSFEFTNRANVKISGANVVGYVEGKKTKKNTSSSRRITITSACKKARFTTARTTMLRARRRCLRWRIFQEK
jgi:hypothetical protein